MAQKGNSQTWNEMQNMKAIKVKLTEVYIDPNNPRFAAAGKEIVPNERITEEGVQNEAKREVERSGIAPLMNSIRTSGFWSIDRVVLRRIGDDNYVVVEGNRRVTSLKLLWEGHNKGIITMPSEVLSGIQEFQALVYEGCNLNIAWITQGFRHTPGIEPWQRYTQAKFLADYERQTGITPQDIALIFGIKPGKLASDLIRAYRGFEQAQNDEDYGDILTPDQFGFFDEIIIAKPAIKNWLKWDDTKKEFTELNNFKEFLSWIPAGNKERTANSPQTIDISPLARDTLTKLMRPEYKVLFEKFRAGELSIRQCEQEIYKFEAKIEPINIAQTLSNLQQIKNILALLPIPIIQKGRTEKQVAQKTKILVLLEEIGSILAQQISNLNK